MAAQNQVGGDVKAALTVAVLLTLIALLIGDSSVGLAVGLLVFPMIVYAMCRVPVRLSMLTLMFFVFALPNPGEGLPSPWVPPFYTIGGILLNHLNTVDRSGPLGAVPLSGLEILYIVLGIIIFFRRSTGSKIDSTGRLPTPKPMIRLALVAIGAALFGWIHGLLAGGDFGMSLWQLAAVIYLPIIFLLFQEGLRGPKDHAALAKVLLAAVTYKCCLAVYIINTVKLLPDPDTGSTRPPYATAHNDSMLFATAFVLLISPLIEGLWKAKWWRWTAGLILPILIAGTMANNRRLAWVQVGLVFIVVYLISRDSPIKKKLRRYVILATPAIALYLNLGWDTQYGSLYKPARMVRSVVDAKSDGSSNWREFENVNLISTFKDSPITGTGYGHKFKEVIVLPAVDYPLEPYAPHNSLLGVWAYGGLVGYAGLSMLWMAGVYFAMRVYYQSSDPYHRVAALVSFGSVLVYLLQSWGDLGLGTLSGTFMMGASLATAGKLASAGGQWFPNKKNEPAPPKVSVPPKAAATGPAPQV